MDRSRGRAPLAGVCLAVVLSGCIAGNPPEVVGGIAISVDEQERPVVVLQTCEPTELAVDVALGREGLAPSETNEQVGTWTTSEPVSGTVELLLHDPASPWEGQAAELLGARTYLVSGSGGGATSLGTVVFGYADLAGLEPGTLYVNSTDDPDVVELVPVSAAELETRACGGA